MIRNNGPETNQPTNPGSEDRRLELLWFTGRYVQATYYFMRGHLQEQRGIPKAKRKEGHID